MKHLSLLFILFIGLTTACGNANTKKTERKVKIETIYGDMVVLLYDQTPLHRDNFIKLSEENFFDSILFHRVIQNFMIQGGDPDSKNAAQGIQLGEGGPGYQIDAEFVPELYHKKGVIAAAREGDKVNPEKKSSGSQFYIVQGKVFTQEELLKMEERINFTMLQRKVYKSIYLPENEAIRQQVDSLRAIKDYAGANRIYSKLAQQIKAQSDSTTWFKYTPEQIEAYSTLGGTPHLDQNYTVFGEVIEGVHVIDSIAAVSTDENDRPLEDVLMKISVLD